MEFSDKRFPQIRRDRPGSFTYRVAFRPTVKPSPKAGFAANRSAGAQLPLFTILTQPQIDQRQPCCRLNECTNLNPDD